VGGIPQQVYDEWVPDPEKLGYRTEIWVQDLEIPWSLVFLDDEIALVSERPGRIRLIQNGRVRQTPYFLSDEIHSAGEGGLMGLAVHPEFPDKPYIYAKHTTGSRVSATNRVIRLHHEGESARYDKTIIDNIPGSLFHNGGRIAFGPDGMLYITTGENFRPSRAQDMENLGGKILRLDPEGEIPGDNPFQGSPVYTLGHRNSQGLAWHPQTGQLINSEHGPSGEYGMRGHDMLNLIEAGSNYGWPEVIGKVNHRRYKDPIVMWEKTTPPGGITFWENDLYVATMRSEALIRVQMETNGNGSESAPVITGIERWYKQQDVERGTWGRFRDAVAGPDGALYVTTTNMDGRGSPRDGDDKILRITRTEEVPGDTE
jgi:glucose/arabinose dehydrogenase